MDYNDYYGSQYASVNMEEIEAMIKQYSAHPTANTNTTTTTTSDATPVYFKPTFHDLNATVNNIHSVSASKYDLRKYSIDIYTSKLLYSNGDIVQLLVQSGVGRYLEFRCVDSILLYLDNSFQRVPCTKGEIFKNTFISLVEKRYLMKFIQFCMEHFKITDANAYDTLYKEYKNKPFVEFLGKHSLSARLQAFILYTIALLDHPDPKVTTKDGLHRVKNYINSLGRYGNSAFLYPMYGTSEILQSFCRVGAVYGGTYVLRRGAAQVEINNGKFEQLTCSEGQTLKSPVFITNQDCQTTQTPVNGETMLRCILVTETPVLNPLQYREIPEQQKNQQNIGGAFVGIIPPNTISPQQSHCITMIQLDHSSGAAPKGKFAITFQAKLNDMSILQACVDKFVPKVYSVTTEQEAVEMPNVHFCVYYKFAVRDAKTHGLATSSDGSNVFVTNDVSSLLDMEHVVNEAKELFAKICPNTEFLPKLPNPEQDDNPQVFDAAAKLLGVDKDMMTAAKEDEEEQESKATTTTTTTTTDTPVEAPAPTSEQLAPASEQQ